MRRALVFKNRSIQCISIAPPKIRSDSDILVRVHAAGINPLDRAMSRGYGAVLLDRLRGSDFVLGQEFSGICTFVGKNVMDVRVGDPVFGAVDPWSQCGTLTDELCVNEADVAKKPANVEHVRAASIPFAVMTVWRPVVQHAVKQRARSALVWGGRGSVGSVCAALLRDLVPGMQNVVVVGREGLESDEQFDVVVDAASTQGFPSDLSRFVKAQGLYCSFNGPWLMMAGEQGLLKGKRKHKKKMEMKRKIGERRERERNLIQ